MVSHYLTKFRRCRRHNKFGMLRRRRILLHGVDDSVGRLDCREMLKLRGTAATKRANVAARSPRRWQILADRRFKTLNNATHGELDAERVDPCGIAVELSGTDGVLEEIVVLILVRADASR